MRLLSTLMFFISITAIAERKVILVNGGYEPTSNYSVHEENLKTFIEAFKGDPTTILNASGKDSKVVKIDETGRIVRDQDGVVALAPSIISEKTSPATKSSLKEAFHSARDAKEIFVLFGDHGGHRGVCLWEDVILTPKELRSLYEEIPNTTLIRSLHIHCYSEAAMIDSERKIPSLSSEWGSYLDQHYPKNRCGLSLAKRDEVGEYIGWGDSWDKSPWHEVIQKPGISLTLLKQWAITKSLPSPVLTSDILVEDMMELFCRRESRSPNQSRHSEPPNAQEPPSEDPCQEFKHDSTRRSLDKKVATELDHADEQLAFVSNLKSRYLKEKYPLKEEAYFETLKKIESLRAEIVILEEEKTVPVETIRKKEEELNRLRTTEYTDYQVFRYSLPRSEEKECFAAFFQENAPKKIKEKEFSQNYPILSKRSDLSEWIKKPPTEITSKAYRDSDKAQKERQTFDVELQLKRRLFIERQLRKPEFRFMKERYEKINQCENASIR